jgi:hypothetical protein
MDILDLHNFHYINEPRIDTDFSQVMKSLITGISTKTITELEFEGGGELSLGRVLEWLGANLGISGNIRKRKVHEQELKQELHVANKLAIVVNILRKEKLLPELFLDSSNIDEQKLVSDLTSSKFCLLNGKFTMDVAIIEDHKYVMFYKDLGSHIISIAASPKYITTYRTVDFLKYRKPPLSAFCYYAPSSSDSVEKPPIIHTFHPRAIWDYSNQSKPE